MSSAAFSFSAVTRCDVVADVLTPSPPRGRFDVVTDVVGVLTSVHPAVGYAFGATKGAPQGCLEGSWLGSKTKAQSRFCFDPRAPLDTPRPWWCVHPTHRNHEGRGRAALFFCAEHGPLPLVISSQNVVLVDDVRSLLARTNGRRFVLYDRARRLASEQLCHRHASGRGRHVMTRYIVAGLRAPRPEEMLRAVTCPPRPDARGCWRTTSGERTSANLSMNRTPRAWFAPATDPTTATSTQPLARSRERVATRADR